MENVSLATREIMWNIPFSFKILMYLFFFISVGFLVKGLRDKYLFVTNGKPFKELLPEKLQWGQFFRTLFFQGKVIRNPFVGFFHGLIFFGFFILWIATDLVAIHYDTPFKVFQGTTYIVISFLADIAGVLILIGISFAFYRRYIKKPDYLKATQPNQELMMYFVIKLLVVIGFLIEGLRILGTGMPEGEASYAPIGYFLAKLFMHANLTDESLALTFRTLWFIHMVSTMLFIASIGYTKFIHMFLAPFNALLTPAIRGGVILPMNFEEERETFGLGKISELSMKNRLDLISCVECGRCTQACPAKAAGKNLDPKLIITKMRDFVIGKSGEISLWEENPIYAANELDACTTCAACMEECPMSIEHVPLIMEARRYKVLTLGEIAPSAGDTVTKIKNNSNPWGISREDRFKWADGLNLPLIQPGKKVEYLYYIGCAGNFDDKNQRVVKDTINLFRKANVDFALIGKGEKCNGDPVRRFGDEYSFYEIAIDNIANLRQYTFDKIVVQCPHCLHTLGKEYAKFENGKFEVIHHTELLAELIRTKKLKPTKPIVKKITFHDPCYLGRHYGNYSAPRKILEMIPGLTINEMEKTKDRAVCCGMGGGNMWYELPEGEHLANNRLKQIAKTASDLLATGCSFCLINFGSAKGHVKETENLEIEDVASILNKSVE